MKRILLVLLLSAPLFAGNKVGNGDDGGDLEGAVLITEGPFVTSRALAIEKLNRLNVGGIHGLGKLIPEVERANLYLSQVDVAGIDSDGPASPEGLVYARTIAEEHAPTRFFPVAMKLDQDQLAALHIHEALHRALPASVRENEKIVRQLTLALTSPEATHDRAALLASDNIPANLQSVPKDEHFQAPSNLGYAFRQFLSGSATSSYPIERMHILHSDLYPFGGNDAPIGFGIEASMVSRSGATETGPLGLSAKMRLWSGRGFDVGLFGSASLNVLSADELKNSPYGRDVYTLGVSLRKDLKRFYIENFLSCTFKGKSKRTVGRVDYEYTYGDIVVAQIRGGARLGDFDVGGFAELNLAESFRVSGGAFNTDLGRYRIFAVGPEFTFKQDEYMAGISGRFLVDSTRGANFDYLGNLMGPGVAQGGVQLSASVLF